MARKFKMISDDDVKVIRAARKVLTRITKKLRRLNNAVDEALEYPGKDCKDCWAARDALYDMLDDVEALDISGLSGELLSIRLLPSGYEAETIRL
jgi:hypothetical protein